MPELTTRGWTSTAIKRFLPSIPDDTRDNPHYANAGSPMKLWLKSRVHRVEKTKRFLAWKQGAEQRQVAATRGVNTRVKNMVERMRNAKITIRRDVTDTQLNALAERTHGGNYAGDPGPFYWSKRAARNCIRHCLTNYETLWAICNRGATGTDAYQLLRSRVDTLIAEAYPQYVDGPDEGKPV